MPQTMLASEDLSRLERQNLRRLLAYWNDKRGNRAMPGRADIDPLDFLYILGNSSLIEVHRGGDGLRYRFRLIGTNVASRLGYDVTGRWLDDVPEPGYRAHLQRAFDRLVASAAPQFERPDMLIDNRVHCYEVLRLPLGADGRTVDMLLTAVDFYNSRV